MEAWLRTLQQCLHRCLGRLDTPAVFAQMSRKVEELSRIGEDSKKSTSNSVNKEANKYILIPVRNEIGAE